MAVTVSEAYDSGRGQDGDGAYTMLTYHIMGTASTLEARTALAAEAPTTFGSLIRQSYEVDPISVDSGSPDTSRWLGTVRYGYRQRAPETGDSVFSFDTGGGTQHITQSIATTKYGLDGEVAPGGTGTIGDDGENVEGVDITIPVYNFTETYYLATAYVTAAYKKNLVNLTGKVNNARFKGLATGEVLFMGASGSLRSEDDWEVTFRFAASPNRTNITIGSITGIDKKGWEHLWVRYAKDKSGTPERQINEAIAVFIEQVYEYAHFSLLGIGT